MTRARTRLLAPALLGATAAVVLGLLVAHLLGGGGKYVLYAKFSDAAGILKNNNVKIGGVPAGEIKDVTLDAQDHAVVRMELDRGAYPVGAGATARVRPVNLLGEKYVDLDPGDLRKPEPSGTTIPVRRTGVPVELDDVLNMLDPDTRGRLRILINEAGVALAGRGADFNRTLSELPPALDQGTALVGQVAAENQTLGRLIGEGDRVIAAVNSRRDDLGALVDSAGRALQSVASRRAQLGRTVQAAPATLAQLRTTLTALRGTAQQLRPALNDLRATSPSLADVLRRAPSFTRDAQAALGAARAVAPELSRLGRRGTPPLRRLAPTAQRLARFASTLQPLMNGLDRQGALKAVLGFVDGWAGVIGNRDGLGNVFRVHATASEQMLTSVLERMAADRPGARRHGLRPPRLPGVTDHMPKNAVPDVHKPVDHAKHVVQQIIDKLPPAVRDKLPKQLPPPPTTPPPPPGSDAQDLLNYLLGG